MYDVNEIKKAANIMDTWGDEEQSDFILMMAEDMSNECYDNGREFASFIDKYKNSDEELKLINETLVCLCG